MDPLAEEFVGATPYNYTLNNPISNIDPDGRFTLEGRAAQDFVRDLQSQLAENEGIENNYTRYIKNGVVQDVKQTGVEGGDVFDRITDVDLDRPLMEAGVSFVVPVQTIESVIPTNISSKDGLSAETLRVPGFIHHYKYKAKSQAIEEMGIDSPFFAVGVSTRFMSTANAAKGGSTFFEGASYSPKVLKATDAFHNFPKSVDGFAAKFGKWSTKVGGDKKTYQWLELKGSYGGKTGTFEYIKDANGTINHRFFNINKKP